MEERKRKRKKKEEGREKREGKREKLAFCSHTHPSIYMSMHGCHAYYCRDDFKHDDQRKSHSAPHHSIIWDFT